MIRPSSIETERLKLTGGLAMLATAYAMLHGGHPQIAGMALGAAAPLLLKPTAKIAELLDLRPSRRLMGALALTGIGWASEVAGVKHGHALAGTLANAVTNVYASHMLPANVAEVKTLARHVERKFQTKLGFT